MGCRFPENTPATGYKKGCRCERCEAANRAWNAEKKRRYAGSCENCGGRTYSGEKQPPRLCSRCTVELVLTPDKREKARPQRELVEQMWREGKTAREICDTIGYRGAKHCAYIARLRNGGYDLPVRNAGSAKANRGAPGLANWRQRTAA